MTVSQFRKLALALPGAIESAHMNHPDFRVHGKIFASLGYPDDTRAMVKLTPPQQHDFMRRAPDVFSPCTGAWGRSGSTQVNLPRATTALARAALHAAAKNLALRPKLPGATDAADGGRGPGKRSRSARATRPAVKAEKRVPSL